MAVTYSKMAFLELSPVSTQKGDNPPRSLQVTTPRAHQSTACSTTPGTVSLPCTFTDFHILFNMHSLDMTDVDNRLSKLGNVLT